MNENQHQRLTFPPGHNIMTIMKVLQVPPIPAAEFKAHCLELMDRVNVKKVEFVVTKHGKPVAKLVPADNAIPELFGFLAGSVTYHGDIVAPLDVTWDAQS